MADDEGEREKEGRSPPSSMAPSSAHVTFWVDEDIREAREAMVAFPCEPFCLLQTLSHGGDG
ncbi:unnamed protein product [Musa hybrid cultivar]